MRVSRPTSFRACDDSNDNETPRGERRYQAGRGAAGTGRFRVLAYARRRRTW
jgi:hypothetical protein